MTSRFKDLRYYIHIPEPDYVSLALTFINIILSDRSKHL